MYDNAIVWRRDDHGNLVSMLVAIPNFKEFQKMLQKPSHTTHIHEDPFLLLQQTLTSLQTYKPNDRSDVDRRYAIVITETEKIIAYYKTYIVDAEPEVKKEPGSEI